MRDRLRSDTCAPLLKALAAPERLKIVQCLVDGPMSVTDLAARVKDELANVSHHLGVLRHAGLVQDERHGKFVQYSLHPDVFRSRSGDGLPDRFELGCCCLQLTGGTK
jgi:DNA-binding transcriptional ArsR family regulator